MKSIQEIRIVAVACVIIISAFVFIAGRSYMHERESLLSSASQAFDEAVSTDNMMQASSSIRYDSCRSLNGPSVEEKMFFCNQAYITEHDSTRQSLDCIFHAMLVKEHMPVPSAVSVSYKNKIRYSCKDTSFYQIASALPPVFYRFDDSPAGRIEMRGYLQLPVGVVLKNMEGLYWWISFWLLLLAIVIGGYVLRRYLGYKLGLKQRKDTVMEKHSPLVQRSMREWTDLSSHICFDRNSGMLCYGEKTVVLTGNPLKLFCLLLDNSGCVVKYKDIASKVIKRKVTNEISKSDKDVVFATVKSLRNSLQEISPISIETFMGKGYKLEIKEGE